MTPKDVREHIAKLLRAEYERLADEIKRLQAEGQNTSKLQALASKMFRAVQEAEKPDDATS